MCMHAVARACRAADLLLTEWHSRVLLYASSQALGRLQCPLRSRYLNAQAGRGQARTLSSLTLLPRATLTAVCCLLCYVLDLRYVCGRDRPLHVGL